MKALLSTCGVTSCLLLVISRLPFGIEFAGLGSAVLMAVLFSVLHTLLNGLLTVLTFPFYVLTLGLFSFVVNGFLFYLAAGFVPGLRLRWGFKSALMGAISLGVLQTALSALLGVSRHY